MRAGSQAARGKIAISGITNRLDYWEIFIVYIKFTNVAAGRMIKPAGLRVGYHAQATRKLKRAIYLSNIYIHSHTHTHTYIYTCIKMQFLPHSKHTEALTIFGS